MRSEEGEQRWAYLPPPRAPAAALSTDRAQEVLRTQGWQGGVATPLFPSTGVTRPPREGPAAMVAQGGWRGVAGFAYVGAKALGESVVAEEAIEVSDSSDGSEDAD